MTMRMCGAWAGKRMWVRRCVVGVMLAGSACVAVSAQNPSQSRSTIPQTVQVPTTVSPEDPQVRQAEAARQKMFTDERHKKIVADTDKLLQLATDLKNEVTTTTKNELSLAVIKKAADIEKLAHDVKERMRQ